MSISKKVLSAGIAAMSIMVAATMSMADDKVKMCHMDNPGDEVGKVIQVSSNAVKAHKEHGDPDYFTVNPDGSCKKTVNVKVPASPYEPIAPSK